MPISVSCKFLSLAGRYRNVVSIFMPRSPTVKAKTKGGDIAKENLTFLRL